MDLNRCLISDCELRHGDIWLFWRCLFLKPIARHQKNSFLARLTLVIMVVSQSIQFFSKRRILSYHFAFPSSFWFLHEARSMRNILLGCCVCYGISMECCLILNQDIIAFLPVNILVVVVNIQVVNILCRKAENCSFLLLSFCTHESIY